MKIRPGSDPGTLFEWLLVATVVAVIVGAVHLLGGVLGPKETPDPPALWEIVEFIVLSDGSFIIITIDGSTWRFDEDWERRGEFNRAKESIPQVPQQRQDEDRSRRMAG